MRSDIARLLKQRGHDVTKEGSDRDILLPQDQSDPEIVDSFKTVLYNLMRRDEIRKSLRDWAFGKVSDRNSSQYVEAFVKLCTQFGGPSDYDNPDARQARYAKTLEWYISELLRREFSARASGFNLRLKDAHPDDEFDCIALLDGGIVFVECKTGRNKIYSDVAKFIRRDSELTAMYSFYLLDRDYVFQKQGDDLPQITREQAHKLGILAIHQISVSNQSFFEIQSASAYGRYFLVCSTFDRLEDRIRYMIRYCDDGTKPRMNRSLMYEREPIFCHGIDARG